MPSQGVRFICMVVAYGLFVSCPRGKYGEKKKSPETISAIVTPLTMEEVYNLTSHTVEAKVSENYEFIKKLL